MLLKFSFENFRSFRQKTTLSMTAKTQRTLNDVLIKKNGHRILPLAIIYGANASGKSNVIQAMKVLWEIIGNGSISSEAAQNPDALELTPFIHDSNTDPTSFDIEFITNEHHYIYHIAFTIEPLVKNGERRITEETLKIILQNEPVLLFHRTADDIKIGNSKKALKLMTYENQEQLEGLTKSVVSNMDNETLFLTGGFKSTIRKSIANEVIRYITQNIVPILRFDEVLKKIRPLFNDEPYNSKKDVNEVVQFINDLVRRFTKAADFGPQQIRWKAKETCESHYRTYEMLSLYHNSLLPSDLIESTGTVRLLQFSLLLTLKFLDGSLLLIDEMDNAIHSEIMKSIISLYANTEANKEGAQLIFTTHNPIYMDRELLRRDQILFAEKDPDTYISTLYSLGDFGSVSVRNDQDYMRNYFKGRYGRLPYVDLEAIFSLNTEKPI